MHLTRNDAAIGRLLGLLPMILRVLARLVCDEQSVEVFIRQDALGQIPEV